MGERKFDRQLNVRTIGIREWREETEDYNRYEATPYVALDKLFTAYTLQPDDHVVDFGSGRGRVSFYMHHYFGVTVTGIEMNDQTFTESLKNLKSYEANNNHKDVPIHFEFGLAEQYEIQADQNIFYFFNPFSIEIFKKVVQNILKSFEQDERTIDIIFYYPLHEFKRFLQMDTPFQLINKINVPGIHGKYGKFAIYRLKAQA